MSSSGFLTYHIRVKLKTWIQAKDSFTLKWSWWWPYRSKFSSCLCDRPLTVVAGRKSRKQSWWSTACDGCTVLPQIQNRGVQGQRGVEGYVRHTTPEGLQTPPQTLVEACGQCRTSDWQKSAGIDSGRLRQYPVGCRWRLLVMFFQPIRLSDWGDIFQEGKLADVKRWLQLCFEVRWEENV